jgi:outer membrane protein assembly factor BamB
MFKKVLFTMIAVGCAIATGADWLTDGGDNQRTAWQRDEKILNKNNVKDMKLLWKLKLPTAPREMHNLFPPLIVERVETNRGVREMAFVSAVADSIFGIDVADGKVVWQKTFTYPTPARAPRATDPLCPAGQNATPVIGPADAAGKRILYLLAGDGKVHHLNLADGEEMITPYQFGYPWGKSYALNLWNDILFTTTAQGCAGNPNQIWAVNVKDPTHKVMTYNPKSGGLWGRTGAAIDSTGTAWAPTGDGVYVPETQTYGNGLVGAKVVGGELKLQDYFMPRNWAWLRQRDLDMQVTPSIFNFKGKELMVTGSKECRMYLLDTRNIGGEDHMTPLDRTPLMCNEEVNFMAAGIWGAMATWEDAQGTRWVLTPFWGPVHSTFKVPISYGPVTHGAVVALKVEEVAGKFKLVPAWMTRNMDQAEPPLIANGVVYSFASGENTDQAYPDRGLMDNSPERIKDSTHATLHAFDALTGKELFNSGSDMTSFVHFGGLSLANGRVYLGTFDGTLYCYGLPAK